MGRRTPTFFYMLAAAAVTLAAASEPRPFPFACADTRRVVLPRVRVVEQNVGRIRHASYWKTELPRPDGRTALVLQDIRATVETPAGFSQFVQSLALIEDASCWTQRVRAGSGVFECYQVDTGTDVFPHVISNEDTRILFSALAYLATGGASDKMSQQPGPAANGTFSDSFLYDMISAPAYLPAWYICQDCAGNQPPPLSKLDAAQLKFAYVRDYTVLLPAKPANYIAVLRPRGRRIKVISCQ